MEFLNLYRALLNREISEYPINVISDTDPKYMKECKDMILFDVNISEYKDVISEHLKKTFDVYRIGLQAKADSTPKDLLQSIRVKIHQVYKLKISTHNKDNGLTIKFEGYSDYLLGNFPLKDYKRVHSVLNDAIPMIRICLTEIPLENKDKNFPPLYFMHPEEQFDFEKLRNSSLMYCYAPKNKVKTLGTMTQNPCIKT